MLKRYAHAGEPSRAEVPFFSRMWVKLAVGSTAIVILAMTFAVGLILRIATDELRSNILRRNEQIARRTAEEIGARLDEARRDLAETADLVRLLERMPWLNNVLLENHVLSSGIFDAIAAVDSSGHIRADNRLGTPGLSLFGAEALTKAGSDTTWTSAVDVDVRGLPGMTFVAPAGHGTSLLARLSLERIWLLIDDIDAGPGGFASLVSSDGTIIAHPDKVAVIERKKFVPPSTPVAHDLLLVSSPVASEGWIVYIQQPVAQAFIPISVMLRRSLLLVLACLALAVLLSSMVAVLYSRSLDALLWGTVRIAEGDLEHQIEEHGRDEFHVLSRAFNDMVRRLRDRTAALANSERRYRHVTESVRDIIFSLDHEGRVVFLNTRVEKVLGFPRDQILGRTVADLVKAQAQRRNLAEEHTPLQSTSPFPRETTVLTRSGEEVILELEGERVGGGEGRGEIHGIARDVTQRRRIEEKLRRSERLAALGEIISKVAHELRNAISGITASMEMAKARGVTGGLEGEMDLVLSEAQRAQDIVQGLLGSSTSRGADLLSCSVNDELAHVIDLRKARFAAAGIEFTLDCSPSAHSVAANPDQLRQVFHNILDNAEHALLQLPADKPRRLQIRTWEDGGRVFAEIADTGPGIRQDVIGKIFDPFFTTRSEAGGSGLGLAVCLAIVEALGGDIAVRSRTDGGAIFTVELPTESARESARSLRAGPDLRGMRMLVVEDEPAIRDFVHHFLESLGSEVDSAGNGQEAVARLAAGTSYSLVISDYSMPDRDGKDLYDWIRASRPGLLKRLIYITGDSLNPATRLFLESTGVPYLLKPVVATLLADLVRRTLAASAA